MAVKIGSARHDENGQYHGGKAGDQTGSEVSTQNWYKHSKGWVLLRAIDAEAREKIAWCMEQACKNNNIGYDQYQNGTLYAAAEPFGFDVSKVSKPVETDCAKLSRVCVSYAGIHSADYYTGNEASVLMRTGAFDKFTDDLHCKHDTNLLRGDILVTKTQGHTVVVLSNGSRAADEAPLELGDRILKNGMVGSDVRELQTDLIQLGYDLGKYGADGEFGDATELAVRDFQFTSQIGVDGEAGEQTIAALKDALSEKEPDNPQTVQIVNGNCYVRMAPNTDGAKLGIAHAGEKYPYGGITSENGWNLIDFGNSNGWVSPKYSKVV